MPIQGSEVHSNRSARGQIRKTNLHTTLLMKKDNQWHPAVVVRMEDTNFGVFQNLDEVAQREELGQIKVHQDREYQEAQWNWNSGNPKLKFPDFELDVVDMDRNGNKIEGTMKVSE